MSNQMGARDRLCKRVVRRLRQALVWESPNQRLASIAGGLALLAFGNLVSAVYWDSLSALLPRLPWLGQMVPWVIAVILGISTDMAARKFLDRFWPKGKRWPNREGQEL
jgi:hypothetical protein